MDVTKLGQLSRMAFQGSACAHELFMGMGMAHEYKSVQDEIAIKSFVNEAEDSTQIKQEECNDHLESQLLYS